MLPSRVVDIIILSINKLGYANKFIAFNSQFFQYIRKRLRRIFSRVMKQNNRAVINLFNDLVFNFRRGFILPIQAVNIPLYAEHSLLLDSLYQTVIIISIRWAKQLRSFSRDILDFNVTIVYFFYHICL